jgi:hypothetical protein
MNAWIYKMATMRRRFRIAAERSPHTERIYWDRRTRKWAVARSHLAAGRP